MTFYFMDASGMPLVATLLCITCQLLGIPVSWRKTILSSTITWIGWEFHFRAGIITIPSDKLKKMLRYIELLLRGPGTTRKNLEKAIGLAMWLTQLFPLMRVWLHYLYQDLYCIPSSHFSLGCGEWLRIHLYLADDLKFNQRPPNSGIPVGSQLVSVRHQPVSSKSELSNLRIPVDK